MTVLYFAWVKEKVGMSEESVAPPPEVATVAGLMDWLASRSRRHAEAFANKSLVKAAVDQVHAPLGTPLAGVREVAFFPPVTGGQPAAVADIRVQAERFDAGAELNRFLARNSGAGGVASFIGQMRDFRGHDRASGKALTAMTLDHYAGMAERQLADVVMEATKRWPLDDVCVIHRFGEFKPGDPIVFVATASAHRGPAFDACAFIMDWLKTKAPFWKKEISADGASWVAAEAGDNARAERWNDGGS